MRQLRVWAVLALCAGAAACSPEPPGKTNGGEMPQHPTAPDAPPPSREAVTEPAGQAISPEDPDSVRRGIEDAAKQGLRRVVIPAGVYRIPPPADDKPWHLAFSDLKNLEIDARGAVFIFLGRATRGILFNYCENVTFRGATLLREIPPFSQGKIESIAPDRASVTVRVDKGYPADLDNKKYFPGIPVFNAYEKGTRALKPQVPDIYLSRIERMGQDLFRFQLRGPLEANIPLAAGDPVAWRGTGGFHDVSVWSCHRVRIEGVTIRNGSGIGFMEIAGEGENTYKDCVITYADPPPGAEDAPLLACGTDGLHSASVRRGPILENCSFEGMNDDAVNIHGKYGLVMEASEGRAVVAWRTPHSGARRPFPFASSGDSLRFYDRQNRLCGETLAVSVRPMPDYAPPAGFATKHTNFLDREGLVYYEVTFAPSVEAQPDGVAANASAIGNGFVIRDCSFRNNRAHGIFIRAGDGLIENCLVEGTLMGGIVIAPEMGGWTESDYAHNVTVRGNTIRNVGVGTQIWNSGITVAAFESNGFVPLPGGHRGITLRDNVLEENRGANIIITSAIGVDVSGNRFVRPMSAPPGRVGGGGVSNDKALVWVRSASQVRFSDNTVDSPGQWFGQVVDADDSVSAQGIEDGFRILKVGDD